MSTRTLVLTNTLLTLGVTPRVGVAVSVYLNTPSGQSVTDLEGGVFFNGQQWGEATTTNSSGTYMETVVYPGDLLDGSGNPLATPCTLTVLEGGIPAMSPAGFSYASSITVSTWYGVGANAAGMLAMLIDLRLISNAARQGASLQLGISQTAIAPNGSTLDGSQFAPVTTDTNGDGIQALWPNSVLNPTTTAYSISFPDGTIWYFIVPANPTGYQGAYAGGTTYSAHAGTKASPPDVVLSGGILYQYINATPAAGHTPASSPTFWTVWVGEPIIWNVTQVVSNGGVVIDATGVSHTSSVPPLVGDPNQSPATLADDMLNIRYDAVHGAAAPIALYYLFDSTTTNANPGSGKLRLNQATQNTSTAIYANTSDDLGVDWTSVLDTLDASTSTVKGQVRLSKVLNRAAWLAFNLTVRTSHTGYREFTLVETGSSTASPFTNGDELVLLFTRTGDIGAPGSSGAGETPLDDDSLVPMPYLPTAPLLSGVGGLDPPQTDYSIPYHKTHMKSTLTIGIIGDSLTIHVPSGGSQSVAAALPTYLNTSGVTVTINNQAVSGQTSTQWAVGGANYNTAKAAFLAGGVDLVLVMLGTNDSNTGNAISAATYFANLLGIATDLVESVAPVMLVNPPYVQPTSGGGYDATSDTRLLGYRPQLAAIVNGTNILAGTTALYWEWEQNPSYTDDGVHPSVSGVGVMAQLLATGLIPVIRALSGVLSRAYLPPALGVLQYDGAALAWVSPHVGEPVLLDPGSFPDFVELGGDLVVL